MLQLVDVHSGYGRSEVIHGVSLEVPSDGVAAVMGHNGAGKTTLLRAAVGLLKCSVGNVHFDGDDITKLRPSARVARGLAYVPQGQQSFGQLTTAENLQVVADGRTNGKQLIDEQLDLFPALKELLTRRAGLLSGGQRQALTVLMATMVRPSLLLLDEHTAALDPRSAELVIRLTREVITAGGLTTLMVTHSMAQAVRLGDRVLVMHRGRVVYDIPEARRRRLAESDLLQLFDQLRWADRLDESAAAMLRQAYV